MARNIRTALRLAELLFEVPTVLSHTRPAFRWIAVLGLGLMKPSTLTDIHKTVHEHENKHE
jgi:hypothetical protein